jgi:lysozyme
MALDPEVANRLGTPEQYATPLQIQMLQEYVKNIRDPKNQPTLYKPWQVAAGVANQMLGGYFAHQAVEQQRQAYANAAANAMPQLTGGSQPSATPSGSSTAQPLSADATDTIGFLKQQEGFSATPYGDYRQTSIGYGTKAQPGDRSITQEEAENRLRQEAGSVNDFIDQNVKVPLSPQQRTALVSFGYNVGTGQGGLSDLLPNINNGDWQGAATRMQHYNHAGGQVLSNLTQRRALEGGLLMQPQKTASANTGTATDAALDRPTVVKSETYAPDGTLISGGQASGQPASAASGPQGAPDANVSPFARRIVSALSGSQPFVAVPSAARAQADAVTGGSASANPTAQGAANAMLVNAVAGRPIAQVPQPQPTQPQTAQSAPSAPVQTAENAQPQSASSFMPQKGMFIPPSAIPQRAYYTEDQVRQTMGSLWATPEQKKFVMDAYIAQHQPIEVPIAGGTVRINPRNPNDQTFFPTLEKGVLEAGGVKAPVYNYMTAKGMGQVPMLQQSGQESGGSSSGGGAPSQGFPLNGNIQQISDWAAQQEARKAAEVEQAKVGPAGAKTTAEELSKAKAVPVAEAIKQGTEARKANQAVGTLGTINNLPGAENINSGPWAQHWLDAKKALQDVTGIDLGGIAPAEGIDKMNAFLASSAAHEMTNRVTQFDFKTWMERNPGIEMSPEGRAMMIDILHQSTKQDAELGRLATKIKDPEQWPDIREQYMQEHPIIVHYRGQTINSADPLNSNPSADPAAAVSKARAAIQAGAPRDAVIKRLQGHGIDTSGL